MSTERRKAVGIQHLTVVPENFEPDAERMPESDDAGLEGRLGERHEDDERSA